LKSLQQEREARTLKGIYDLRGLKPAAEWRLRKV